MEKYIILDKRKNLKKVTSAIKELNMTNSLRNKRTTIWENDKLQISIDRSIIRILIYNSEDIKYYSYLLQR